MFKRDKIFVFLVVLFSVLVLWLSSVFATEVLPSYPDDINNYKYYIVSSSSVGSRGGYYYLFGFNESIEIKKNGGNYTYIPDGGLGGILYKCDTTEENPKWSLYALSDQGDFTVGASDNVVEFACPELQEYLDEMNSNEDFFMSPPTAEIPETQGVLAPIYQTTPLEEVVKEILEILPVILVILVGLIGLRKALKFLQTVLHRS